MPSEWSDRRDALSQGCVLRDYTIQEVLGHGGFGIVYKARHNELDHVVAVKEYLPSELAVREGTTVRAKSAECETHFADGLRRFREEAKALIEFQHHPSIVDCREFFRANGTAYLVMEHVEGLPLSEVLRQREGAGEPFTESDLLAIAIPLAQGLAHIHRAGVIHRDIKPANILVRSSDQRPVLIDFGAAKQAVAQHSRSLAPYTEGYAALEQVADGQLGPWTDLYGFGAVLWRMVAGGNRPWEPPNPVKVESRANARLREAEDPLPAAKELGAGRFANGLLEVIDGCLRLGDTARIRESDRVVQLLEKSGEESHQAEVSELQAEGPPEGDLPDPVSEEARTGRFPEGRPWKTVGAAAAIAVAVVLATVALIPRDESSETLDRWSFNIEADPPRATIALVNGSEEYRPGMLLSPGQYEVEVSAPGYVALREWVTHSASETLHRVELEPLPNADLEPAQIPAGAPAGGGDSSVAETEHIPIDVSKATEPVAADPVAARDQASVDGNGESQATCEGGNWADCFQLGKSYRTGDGVPQDAARAAEFFGQACDGGHAEACSHLGVLYSNGEGVVENKTRAAELYAHACERGTAVGCFNLGSSYRSGEGVGKDPARAAEFYGRACEGQYVNGCYYLAGLYYAGEGVGRDLSRAAELAKLACEGGAMRACGFLGDRYLRGEGLPQDSRRAAELFGRACDAGEAQGCTYLGALYAMGEGVGQDWGRAAELYHWACEGGSAAGCSNLGFLHAKGEGVRQDLALAAELHSRACEGGYAIGCNDLGNSYASGEGVAKDPARAAELYEHACAAGVSKGCNNLGSSYSKGEGVGIDKARAAELYRRACEGGETVACYNLGSLYYNGEGVGENKVRAAELNGQACEGGHAIGCSILGIMYFNGEGVEEDKARAAELYRRACGGGGMVACYNLGVMYAEGGVVEEDRSRAAELFQRACDGDVMSGCYNLAFSYYRGLGVGQDRSIAAQLFEKACTNGLQEACESLELLDWR